MSLSDIGGAAFLSMGKSADKDSLPTASGGPDAVSTAVSVSTKVTALPVPGVDKSVRSEQGSRTIDLGTASSGPGFLAFIEHSLEELAGAAENLCPGSVVELAICCSMSSSETPESSQTLPDATISCSRGVCENPPDVFDD